MRMARARFRPPKACCDGGRGYPLGGQAVTRHVSVTLLLFCLAILTGFAGCGSRTPRTEEVTQPGIRAEEVFNRAARAMEEYGGAVFQGDFTQKINGLEGQPGLPSEVTVTGTVEGRIRTHCPAGEAAEEAQVLSLNPLVPGGEQRIRLILVPGEGLYLYGSLQGSAPGWYLYPVSREGGEEEAWSGLAPYSHLHVPYGDLGPLLPSVERMEVRDVREEDHEVVVEAFPTREVLEGVLRRKFSQGWGAGATPEEVEAAVGRTLQSMTGRILFTFRSPDLLPLSISQEVLYSVPLSPREGSTMVQYRDLSRLEFSFREEEMAISRPPGDVEVRILNPLQPGPF